MVVLTFPPPQDLKRELKESVSETAAGIRKIEKLKEKLDSQGGWVNDNNAGGRLLLDGQNWKRYPLMERELGEYKNAFGSIRYRDEYGEYALDAYPRKEELVSGMSSGY